MVSGIIVVTLDSCLHHSAIFRPRVKIKKIIKFTIGKCSFRPDYEFLINTAFAILYSINLAYRQFHRLSQLGQVTVSSIAHFKNLRPNYHFYRTSDAN